MKHLFIVNPIAGGKDSTAMIRAAVERAFAGRSDAFEVYTTSAPMDAAVKIQREASGGGHIRVYACGGDGTFNECVCGTALLRNAAVCPFPTGTGNDFCRMFGEEKDLFRDLDALLDGTEHPIDLIKCNDRWCANIASVGIDARIGTSVHKYSRLPLIGGSTGYVVSTVVNVFQGISRFMRVRSSEYSDEGKYALICLCNGRFYGGGFNPSPTARPDDGAADVFIAKKTGLLKFAALIGKYASGRADSIKDIIHIQSNEVHVEFNEENVVNIDGEALWAKEVTFRLVPAACNLIVPRGMKFFSISQFKEN